MRMEGMRTCTQFSLFRFTFLKNAHCDVVRSLHSFLKPFGLSSTFIPVEHIFEWLEPIVTHFPLPEV